jgi:hypothetical protein
LTGWYWVHGRASGDRAQIRSALGRLHTARQRT